MKCELINMSMGQRKIWVPSIHWATRTVLQESNLSHLREFICDRHPSYCYNYSVIFIFPFILYLTSWKVCELDIIFNFEKAYFMLDELILGGEIQETSKKNVLKAISAQDLLQEVWKSFLVAYSIPSLFWHSQVGGMFGKVCLLSVAPSKIQSYILLQSIICIAKSHLHTTTELELMAPLKSTCKGVGDM